MRRGKFIVLEGIDGAGKTTQVQMLAERLVQRGTSVLTTREPGGTRIGEQVRNLLLNPGNRELNYRAETFLYAADRAQHVGEKIIPALEKGTTVICDRFTDSTLAYQGGGRGIDVQFLARVNDLATAGLVPDLVIILDVPPEVGVKRTRDKPGEIDRLEAEDLEFYNRVRETYLALARDATGRYRVVDGRGGPVEVHRRVWQEVVKMFDGRF